MLFDLDDLVLFESIPASGGTEFVRAQARERPGERYVIHRRTAASPRGRAVAALHRCRRVVEAHHLHCMLPFVASLGPADEPMMVYGDAPLAELQRLGESSLEDVLRRAIDVLDALAEVHAAGLVHHGLQSGSVAFTPGGAVLLDFAQASATQVERVDLASPWLIEGDLRYVSPERTGRVNRGIDHRSDYYSLGVILHEMLVREPPFRADDPFDLIYEHLTRPPPSPHELDPTIPRFVSDIVQKLLAKDPERRYQSADGIHADLALALSHLRGQAGLPDAVGSLDVPYDLHLSRRLYGRVVERAELRAAFERACAGSREVVYLSGHPGIGKTSLIRETYAPITRQRAYFVAGKFEQLERRVPYSAWLAALGGLVETVLSEPEARVEACRRRLDAALGARAAALIEVLPGLVALLGRRAPGATLPPREAQEWLIEGFCALLAAFSAPERPLTVFLDDLQWADAASLNLLERVVADPRCRSVFLITASRDHEVAPAHRLRLTLDRIASDTEVTLTRISLSGLSRGELTQLVADTFLVAPEEAEPLAAVVAGKSGGNPFFTWQFLQLLRGAGLLRFDVARLRWTWDLAQIEAQGHAENVIELMLHRLRALPEATCAALSWAACLGSRFDLELLAALMDDGRGLDLEETLAPALREELLVAVEGRGGEAGLRFAHDRVQEAAYRLLDDGQAAAAHLRIARLLARDRPPSELAERSFEIADHLNHAASLLTSDEERLEHARVNLQAAHRAGESAAFEAALAYATSAMSLLPADAWTREPALTRELYATRGEYEYLAGDPDVAELSVRAAIAHEADAIRRAELHRMLVAQYTLRADYPGAIEAGRAGLELLGVALPEADLDARLGSELERVDALLGGRSLAILAVREAMTDPVQLVVMKLLIAMGPPCYRSHPRLWSVLVATEVRLCLEHGRAPGLKYTLPAFGGLRMHLGRGSAGECAEIHAATQDMIAASRSPSDASVGHLMRGSSLMHWFAPLSRASAAYEEAFTCGVDSGNLQYAAYAVAHDAYCRFYAGMPLDRLAARLDTSWQFCAQRRNVWGMELLEGVRRLVGELRRGALDPDFALGDRPEADFLTGCVANGDAQVLGIYHMMKAEALVHLERHDRAAAALARAREYVALVEVQGLLPQTQCAFIRALLSLSSPERLGLSPAEGLVEARQIQRRIERWAAGCPENFEHMAALLAAEVAAASGGDAMTIVDAFDRAIDSALRQGMPHRAGLAATRAAAWWRARGRPHYAAACESRAASAYRRWRGDGGEPEARRSSAEPREAWRPELDMRDVVRIAAAVSASTELREVVHAVVVSVSRVSGAQRTVLVLSNHRGEMRAWDTARDREGTREGVALEHIADLPRTVLQYVQRTREPARFDGRGPSAFSDDPYLQAARPASGVCVPLQLAGELQGLLYLEHREIFDAFDASRLDLVHFLAGTAAVAVRNADLVGELRADIAHRVDTERRLAESEREQRLLIDQSPLAIEVYSAEGQLLRSNRAHAELPGEEPTPGELGSHPLIARDAEVLRRVLTGDALDLGTRRSRDGERWFHGRSYGVTSPSGALERIVLLQEDISERRRVERLKAEFVATVSHELRTPVTSIVGTLGLLTGGVAGPLPAAVRELLDIAANNSERLGRMIDDVLDIERSERGELELRPEELELAALLRHVVEAHHDHAQERGVHLQLELGEDPGTTTLTADGARFAQVLSIMVSNAVKFSARGASVVIRGACGPDRVRVEVRDAGSGVPEAFRPRLFDRFAQADGSDARAHGGMGLGLSVARALVLRMGGSIGYAPIEPVGSCFYVEIPRP